jgi:hypothetical protein
VVSCKYVVHSEYIYVSGRQCNKYETPFYLLNKLNYFLMIFKFLICMVGAKHCDAKNFMD